MPTLRELSDSLLSGRADIRDPAHHPFAFVDQIEEVAPGIAFYKAFVNVTAVRTAEGLVLVDTGPFQPALHQRSFAAIRQFAKDPVHTAIYTHGHVDHAYGLPPFLREADAERWARPAIVGHVDVAPRMRRYIETAGYNSAINTRQFSMPVQWPVNPDYPTTTYRDELRLRVGGRELELHHARGETDDHTWVWIPDARTLCTGDLFIWASPNAGNPQKVQRYASDWAEALRTMAAREAQVLLPGHGVPIFGAERVRAALLDTADYLESLYRQTLDALEPRRNHLRDHRGGEAAGGARRPAVPAAHVRRARVHRAQRGPLSRRLVHGRAERAEAGAALAAGARARGAGGRDAEAARARQPVSRCR